MIEEEFRSVKGYEGLYEVSNYGRVRSLNYHREGKIRVLKKQLDKEGYEIVALYKNSKRKLCKVHRLVAIAFIPNPDNLPEVNHINECKQSNIVTNLEWCDRRYNNTYGTRTERVAEKQSVRVYQYTKSGAVVRSYPSTKEAQRRTGYNQGYISQCCLGKRKQAYGYRWSYEPPTPTTNHALF